MPSPIHYSKSCINIRFFFWGQRIFDSFFFSYSIFLSDSIFEIYFSFLEFQMGDTPTVLIIFSFFFKGNLPSFYIKNLVSLFLPSLTFFIFNVFSQPFLIYIKNLCLGKYTHSN